MRSFFNIIAFIFVVSVAAHGITLEKTMPSGDEYMGIFARSFENHEDITSGTPLYLGYDSQVTGGAYNGRSDFSAKIWLGKSTSGLIIRFLATDDEITEEETFCISYGWKGGSTECLEWNTETGVFPQGRVYMDSYGRIVSDVMIPWPGGVQFLNIPLMIQIEVADTDRYGRKLVRLAEEPVSIYLQKESESGDMSLKLLTPSRFSSWENGVYCEVSVPKQGTYPYKAVLNGEKKYSGDCYLESGINSLILRGLSLNSSENMHVYLNIGGLETESDISFSGDSISYKFAIVSDKEKASAVMKQASRKYKSPVFDEEYEYFLLKESADESFAAVITGSYDDLYLCNPALAGDAGVMGFITGYESDTFDLSVLLDFIAKHGEKIKFLVIYPDVQELVLNEMIRNPHADFPPVVVVYPGNMGRIFFETESDNLKNYDLSVLYDKNRENPDVPGYVKRIALAYTDPLAFWDYAVKCVQMRDNMMYLYSTTPDNNSIGEFKVFALDDTDAGYFSLVVAREAVMKIYPENISYFTFKAPLGIKKVEINEKVYPIFEGAVNRFFRQQDSGLWNIMVSDNVTFPAFSDIFQERLLAYNTQNGDKFNAETGYRLYEPGKGNILFWGDDIPGDLIEEFGITLEEEGFYASDQHFIKFDEGFTALFESPERVLLWCNMDPLPYAFYSVNYITTDNMERITATGTVIRP